MKKDIEERSKYEIKHGYVSRHDLIKNVEGKLNDLTDYDFHLVYGLIWSLSTKQLLISNSKKSV